MTFQSQQRRLALGRAERRAKDALAARHPEEYAALVIDEMRLEGYVDQATTDRVPRTQATVTSIDAAAAARNRGDAPGRVRH